MRGSTSVLSGLLAAVVVSAVVLLASPTSTSASPAMRQVASAAGASSDSRTVTLVQRDTPSGPVERSYLYTVPRAGGSGPRPVVLVLHGRSQPVEDLRATTGLEALGEQEGFVSVFPSGVQGVWNAGTCCAPRSGPPMPDVAFLDQVVADLSTRTPVDLARLHVVGFSNGGMMAYRYACQRSDRVAGVAVVSGSMAASPDYADQGPQRCRPATPVSVLAVHGSGDTTVPYDGGRVAGPGGGTVAPARAGVDQSAVGAGCRTGTTSKLGATVRLDYRDCDGGAAVRLVKINGQGHGWTRDSKRFGYDTTAGIWQFLRDRRAAPASS